MMTDIRVSGYICEPNEIEVGAAGSHGVAKLRFQFDDAWDGLSRRVTWMTKLGKISTLLGLDDCVEVPPEALETAGRRWFSVDGTAEGKKLITARCVYRVRETVPPGGENSAPPTPDEMEQMNILLNEVKDEVVAAADRAEEAANGIEETRELAEAAARIAAESAANAEDVAKRAERLMTDVETAVNDAERCADEALNNASLANKSSVRAAEAAETAEAAADRVETAALHAPKVENGNWWVYDAAREAYTDTGVQAQGPAGEPGNGIRNIMWIDGRVMSEGGRVVSREDKYRITLDDGSTFVFTVTGGADGETGPAGHSIRDISFIEETEEGYLYNAYVNMTPYPIMVPRGPKGDAGPKGDKGDKGDTGAGFVVLDYYASLSALQAAIPNPTVGAAYGVGTAEPYDIYIYGETSGWVNNGALQGAKGDKGDQGENGEDGSDGVGIASVTQTTTSSADGGENIVTVTLTNGQKSTFKFKNGSKGSTGATGATGAKGDKGDTGAKGDKGDTGAAGASAFAQAKAAGYTGSEADFYAALVSIQNKADADHTHTASQVGARSSSWTPSQTQVTVSDATDYTTCRVRGIVLAQDNPVDVPNGCLCGVYTIS